MATLFTHSNAHLAESWVETIPQTSVRTTMTSGKINQTKRLTKVYATTTVTLLLTQAEKDTLGAAFVNSGHTYNDWTDPITAATDQYRIISDVTFTPIKMPTGFEYKTSFTLERLI